MGLDDDRTILGGGGEVDRGTGSLSAGEQLGDYRIMRLLGKGAMGEVYEAEQVHLGQRYALKVLPAELSRDPNFRERFRTEARTLASLRHPGIVSVMNAGEARERFFLVMELLAPFRVPTAAGDATHQVGEVRRVLSQILSGLSHAHGKGIVHRDLKPANLLLGEDGSVKIADFGVARVVGEEFVKTVVQETIVRTRLGEASTILGPPGSPPGPGSGSSSGSDYAGTLQYMAPEVLEGGLATEKSDLYAVGVMAYEWLTGRKPVGKYKDASSLVERLDPAWDRWIDTLLEPDKEDRTSSAEAALEALPASPYAAPRVKRTRSVPDQGERAMPTPETTRAYDPLSWKACALSGIRVGAVFVGLFVFIGTLSIGLPKWDELPGILIGFLVLAVVASGLVRAMRLSGVSGKRKRGVLHLAVFTVVPVVLGTMFDEDPENGLIVSSILMGVLLALIVLGAAIKKLYRWAFRK